MKTTIKSVNAKGVAQIAAFLLKNHVLGERMQAPDLLRAWVGDAEFSLSEGNAPEIEIPSFRSIHGKTQTFTISDDGIDSRDVEIDE
jgi:hypothetical protein